MAIQTIFHAHNWPFSRVHAQLDDLKKSGYDAIQLSPAQKSPPGDAWYLRYQPLDPLEISGLGDRKELTELCAEAKRRRITIVADVVFNHTAIPKDARRDDWLAAEKQRLMGNDAPIERLYAKLSWLPHLTRADFQPWRDMQGVDWDNENRYESWGNGEWPELSPTENVLNLHRQHLKILFDCGVRGFRFDAVKHMRASHVAEYLKTIAQFPEPCWSYGEVFSTDPSMHREYDSLFPTTDFPFIIHLKTALKNNTPFQIDPHRDFLSPISIRFGNNHDLACNPKHLVEGLLFEEPQHTRLANCLAAIIKGGTALVFADDHLQDAQLRASVAFRRTTGGLRGPITVTQQGPQNPFQWLIAAAQGSMILEFN